jgi:hypothetical protein
MYAIPDDSSTRHLDFETTDEDSSRTLDPLRANDMLKLIQAKNWTLGTFLCDLFSVPKIQKKDGNPQTQTQMISIFLRGRSKIKALPPLSPLWREYLMPWIIARVRQMESQADITYHIILENIAWLANNVYHLFPRQCRKHNQSRFAASRSCDTENVDAIKDAAGIK